MAALKFLFIVGCICLVAGQGPSGPAGFGFGYGGHHGHHAYPVHHAPVHHVPVHHAPVHHYDDLAVPTSYKFEYGVKDAHTHDLKSQQEHKDGAHHVTGSYELVEPDGSKRVVHYTSDEHLGFVAHVSKHGPYLHPHGAHSYHNMNLHV